MATRMNEATGSVKKATGIPRGGSLGDRHKKTYLDFLAGTEFTSPRRTITETHLVMFAGITGDFYPLHTDEVQARSTAFGRRIAHGPFVYSTAIGLMFESGIYEDVILAFLGVKELRHLAPCFIGDTLQVVATVAEARPTSDGTKGIVTISYDVKSVEDGRMLMTGDLNFMMHGVQSRNVSRQE